MKNDGWFGDIPKHWTSKRIKWIVKSSNNGIWGSDPSESDEDIIACLRVADFNRQKQSVNFDNLTYRAVSKKEQQNRLINFGDLLLEKSGGGEKQPVGFVVRSENTFPAVSSNFIAVLKLYANADSNYFKYVFSSLYSQRINLKSIKQTTGIQNLDQESYFNETIPFPTLLEQKLIAAFLDDKTHRVDTLISKKQKLIELLQEKRQAIIDEAVTKGLDPSAPMKDSGIEWLGDIPAHWNISRFDYVTTVKARLGWKGLKADEYVDDGFVFLATPNIKGQFIDFENVNYISEVRYLESPEIMLQENDVLLAKDGSTLGTVNVVRELPRPSTVNSSIAVIRPGNQILGTYLYYFLSTNYMQQVIQRFKDGMGVPHLFQRDINKFMIILPSIVEQKDIVSHLDEKVNNLNALLFKLEYQIEKLNEYRQSLISEAVTGKIDVRNYGKEVMQ